MNNAILNPKRLMLVLALLLIQMVSMTSCSGDEPDMVVGYYLSVQYQEGTLASTQGSADGIMGESEGGNIMISTINDLRQAIKDAYPVPSKKGNDVAVLTACDSIYRAYKKMYGQMEQGTICVLHICRANMDGEIVKDSRILTVYRFGALPIHAGTP